MTTKNCPKPLSLSSAYDVRATFCGTIVSLFTAERGIFYVVDEVLFEKFCEFEKFKLSNPLRSVTSINFGETFVYAKSEGCCYRAYRLHSNTANKESLQAFLIDVGVTVYDNVLKNKLFKLPTELSKTRPMAIPCVINEFPSNQEMTKTEFLEKSLFSSFNFTVKRVIRMDNALGPNERCIVVDVEELRKEDDEKEDNASCETAQSSSRGTIQQKPLESKNKSTKSKHSTHLTYFEDISGQNIPITCDQIPTPHVPWPGTMIMLMPTEVSGPASFYAGHMKQEDFTCELESKFLNLMLWMNDKDVIKNYKAFNQKPKVGEMVISNGKDDNFQRFVVKEVDGSIFTIFSVDSGYLLQRFAQSLYKFPREFASLPFQTVHLTIDNMTSFWDQQRQFEATEIIESELGSAAMAYVIASSIKDSQVELVVEIFDHDGISFKDIIQDRLDQR